MKYYGFYQTYHLPIPNEQFYKNLSSFHNVFNKTYHTMLSNFPLCQQFYNYSETTLPHKCEHIFVNGRTLKPDFDVTIDSSFYCFPVKAIS